MRNRSPDNLAIVMNLVILVVNLPQLSKRIPGIAGKSRSINYGNLIRNNMSNSSG